MGPPPVSVHLARIWAFLAIFSIAAAQEGDFRKWTFTTGKTLHAKLVLIEKDVVTVNLGGGGFETKIYKEDLSKSDLDYIRESEKSLGVAPSPAPAPKIQTFDWPKVLTPDLSFEPKQVSEKIFETPHFRFESDVPLAKSLVKEFSIAFESTFFALENLPLNLDPTSKEGKYVVRLFREYNAYLTAGGSVNSGGIYMSKSREVLVPLSSLGIRVIGKQVALNKRTYDSATLKHEITHQMMHNFLGLLPIWFQEGMAEYIASVPFDGREFHFDRAIEGLSEHLRQGYGAKTDISGNYVVDMIPPYELMDVSYENWSRAVGAGKGKLYYQSALLLAHFFINLDGKTNGKVPLVAYSRQASGEATKIDDFIGSYEAARRAYVKAEEEYVKEAEKFNLMISEFRLQVNEYNRRIATYNQQVARRVPAEKRIKVGPQPKPPASKPPKPPKVPLILQQSQEMDPIDFSAIEPEARKALLQGRDDEVLWNAIEKAFGRKKIRIQAVSGGS